MHSLPVCNMASPVSVSPEMILAASPGDTGTQMVLVTSLAKQAAPQFGEGGTVFPVETTVGQEPAGFIAEPKYPDLANVSKGNVESNTTLLDINQFMEVEYTYRCKFCDFSTKVAADMSSHVLSMHIEKPVTGTSSAELCDTSKSSAVKTELMDHVYNAALDSDRAPKVHILNEGGLSDVSTPVETLSLGMVTNIQEDPAPMLQDSAANTESICQEIFMCGQCTLGFTNIEQCKQHMCDEHNITLLTEQDSEGLPKEEECQSISATVRDPDMDKVSTGTQVMILKKPGRKRKQPETQEPDDSDGQKNYLLELKLEFKDETSDDVAEMPIFNEEFLSEREREGKRRIKIPKSLQHDYYVTGSRDNKKPLQVSAPKKYLSTQLRKDLIASYSVKCKVIGCKARFQTESSLEEHVKCHSKTDSGEVNKGFVCTCCSFTSLQWSPVRLHLWMKHNINLDLLSCDKCDYHTDAVHKLEIHQQIHDEERRFPCDVCERSFKQLSQLMHHTKSHKMGGDGTSSKTRSHKASQCHICNRVMADSKSLKNHIQYVHEKLRCFSCKFCGHTAARKHMLKVHMRTHTGERPHKCDLCSFTTNDHNTLRRHRLRHTGEKPYQCQYCPYACIQAISLKVHMKNKHQNCEGLRYCQLCHYHTVSEKNWLQHQQDHKNGLIDEHSQKNVVNANSKKQNSLVMEQKAITEGATSTENGAEGLNLYEVSGRAAGVEVSNITEIIQSSSGEVTTACPANVQYIYYTFDENADKEELVISKGLLTADGATAVSSAKPAFQAVQMAQDGEGEALSFTLQPVAGDEQQLILESVSPAGQPLLGIKAETVELVGSPLATAKLANQ